MWTAAELVRAARRAADLSQRQLAEKARVASSTVARLETGDLDPTYAKLCALLHAADCRLIPFGPDTRHLRRVVDGRLRDRAGRRFPAHLDVHLPPDWKHGVSPPRRMPLPDARFYLRRRVRDARRRMGFLDAREADHRRLPPYPPRRLPAPAPAPVAGRVPRRLRSRLP